VLAPGPGIAATTADSRRPQVSASAIPTARGCKRLLGDGKRPVGGHRHKPSRDPLDGMLFRVASYPANATPGISREHP
jgi:hypothetical protein